MGATPDTRCLLRRHGAQPGAIQAHTVSDPDHYGRLRWRPTRSLHILQTAHGVRNARGEAESFPHYWSVGPRGDTDAAQRSRRTEVWRSERFGSEQASYGMVRLGDEEREEAGVFEKARGVLRGRSRRRKLEVCR